jgi:cytochrome c oxidase subunit 2
MFAVDILPQMFNHAMSHPLIGSYGLPNSDSTFGPKIQWLWNFWFWVSVFFTVLITGLAVYFSIKYRFRKGIREAADPSADHNTPLEITWSVIPLIIMLVMFVLGFKYYMDMDQPPSGCYNIGVLAWQWKWQFSYPDGATTSTLYIPVDTPVKFSMTSKDVLHGFWIPELSIQRDVIPGRTMTVWVKAIHTGHFKLQCAEYCGDGHSEMIANVDVLPIPEFKKKLAQAADIWVHDGKVLPLHVVGKKIAELEGCLGCHSVNGARGTGPTWKNLAGSQVKLVSGTATVDYAYLRQAILYPGHKMVAGFNNVMPNYYTDFGGAAHKKHRKLDALIWFINSLSVHANKASRPPVPDMPGKASTLSASKQATAAPATPATTAAVKMPAAALPMIAAGKKLYASMGCIGCHTVNGTAGVGPTWKNLAGYPVKLTSGKTVLADYKFLRFMILYPGKKVVAGFQPIMPSYTTALAGAKNVKKLDSLIWYINSLSDKASASTEPPTK